jgi:superfamily II DNA or RNA helicase
MKNKEKHKSGEILGLVNAQLLTEGYDDWSISLVILCAPTHNPSKYTQEVGRVTRLQEGTGNLRDYYDLRDLKYGTHIDIKYDAYVLDIVDNSKKCSLVTLPSLLGLNPDMDLQGRDVLEVVEEMEELQEQYPGVDFTPLTDLSQIKSFIESIDLFSEPYTEEVKEFSTLTWMATQDGAYVLSIPERRELKDAKAFARFLHEKLHIKMNELDEWELSITTVDTEKKLGTFNTLQEAFVTADDVIRRCRPDRLKVMERNAEWHKYPASEPAKKLLRQRSKSKPVPYCLCIGAGKEGELCFTCKKPKGITAGQASSALNILAARK